MTTLTGHQHTLLSRIYFDSANAGSYGGVQPLLRAARAANPNLNAKQVRAFLTSVPSWSIQHGQRVHFPRRRVVSFDIDWLWEIDIAYMNKVAAANDGFKYLLFKIDVLSKRLAIEPLRTKTARATLAALKRICTREGVLPQHIACDAGREFTAGSIQAWARANNIRFYFVRRSSHGAPNVERVIRTIKARLYRLLRHRRLTQRTHRYIDELQDIVTAYNHARHRSIRCAPVEVTPANVDVIFGRLFPAERLPPRARLASGDHVRTAITRKDFHRGFAPQFNEQVLVVRRTLRTSPPTYLLKKLDGKAISGAFYEAQLLPVFIMPEAPLSGPIVADSLELETDDE